MYTTRFTGGIYFEEVFYKKIYQVNSLVCIRYINLRTQIFGIELSQYRIKNVSEDNSFFNAVINCKKIKKFLTI